MGLERLRIIMHDIFETGVCHQKYRISRKKTFLWRCYREWAVEELYTACASGVYPLKEAPIADIEQIVVDFYLRMLAYKSIDPRNADMWECAAQIAYELDVVLNDMM